jgi:hypothetical protein
MLVVVMTVMMVDVADKLWCDVVVGDDGPGKGVADSGTSKFSGHMFLTHVITQLGNVPADRHVTLLATNNHVHVHTTPTTTSR